MSDQGGFSEESPDGIPDKTPLRETFDGIPKGIPAEILMCEIPYEIPDGLPDEIPLREISLHNVPDETSRLLLTQPADINELERDYRRAKSEYRDPALGLWTLMSSAAGQEARRPEIDLRHGNRGQHTILKMTDQDGVPKHLNSLLDMDFPRERCVEAMQAEEGSLDAAIDYLLGGSTTLMGAIAMSLGENVIASTVHRPLNDQDGVPDQPAEPAVETSVKTSVDSDAPILGIEDIDQDF